MRWNKIIRYPFLCIMVVMIFGISILFLFKKQTSFSELENRYLASRPSFSIDALLNGTFSKEYETYVNEQFPWRDQWIILKADLESYLGKLENNGVIKGKEGYLFNKKFSLSKQASKNISLLKKFGEEIELFQKENNKEVKVNVSIAPNSYGILEEYLPKGVPNIDQKEILGQWKEELFHVKALSYLDLVSTLQEHKSEYIYYQTDHHWTTLGAYYAYVAFCEKNDMIPKEWNAYNKRVISDFYGTYYSKYLGSQIEPDKLTLYNAPIEEIYVGNETYNNFYNEDALHTRDKYAAFLYGNNPLTKIDCNNVNKQGIHKNILIIKDSYANCLVPFLANHYNTIYVVDLRYYKENILDLVKQEGIEEIWVLYNFDTFAEDNHLYRLLNEKKKIEK